jgi:peptide deformylase
MRLTRRVLKLPAKPVGFEYPLRNHILATKMLEIMRMERGIGLAATQVGERQRLFVMEIDGVTRCCFNPEITHSADNWVDYNEGCLSFKGESCIIKRPETVDVRYQEYQGEWRQEQLTGLAARCFQHELDHLNGITMWDRYKEQHAEQSGN